MMNLNGNQQTSICHYLRVEKLCNENKMVALTILSIWGLDEKDWPSEVVGDTLCGTDQDNP